ncbi:MAG: anaerobic sulfatase maturase [Chloroflexi bacterium]|nr:anaerobic sulfatase maturase [Chloroflexota bacterium]
MTPSAFHVMLKPRGAICNLDCRYCFFLSKERLYPNSTFRMSDALLEDYTRQYIQAQRVPEATFAWQGGEPTLMGLDFFRRAVELQKQYAKPEMTIHNALQTNATTLDDEWCKFFRENDFLLGVSLDGPCELHDAYRVDKGGAPTFDRVMRGIELLKQYRVEFNILTTVHAANAEHPLQVYRFLRDEVKTHFIQFIPIVERDNATGFQEGDEVTARSVTGKQYGNFLIAIFDEWVRRDVGRVFVQLFDVALGVWSGHPASLCIFADTCGSALAMEHNGDLFACDHFVEPRFKLGKLSETRLIEMVASPQQRQFGLDKQDTLPRYCRECSVRFICNGGCPKDRVLKTPEGEPGLNYLCEGFKAFFTHIDQPMKTMAQLLREQRPPADIMLMLARHEVELKHAFKMAGRNSPCPCGSGKKFKQCHGADRTP